MLRYQLFIIFVMGVAQADQVRWTAIPGFEELLQKTLNGR